jgi:hypothetical protein
MNEEQELLKRLSIHFEPVVGCSGYHYLALDMEPDGLCDQIGLEDTPGTMILEFTDEALLENTELDPDVAKLLQKHRTAVVQWVKDKGYRPILND